MSPALASGFFTTIRLLRVCQCHEVSITGLDLKPDGNALFVALVEIRFISVLIAASDVAVLSGHGEKESTTVIMYLTDDKDIGTRASLIAGSHVFRITGHLGLGGEVVLAETSHTICGDSDSCPLHGAGSGVVLAH